MLADDRRSVCLRVNSLAGEQEVVALTPRSTGAFRSRHMRRRGQPSIFPVAHRSQARGGAASAPCSIAAGHGGDDLWAAATGMTAPGAPLGGQPRDAREHVAPTRDGTSHLLRLLTPKAGASELEERLRANTIMQHAIKGPRVSLPPPGTAAEPDAADRLRALQILQDVFRDGRQAPSPASATERSPQGAQDTCVLPRREAAAIAGTSLGGIDEDATPTEGAATSCRGAAALATSPALAPQPPPCSDHELCVTLTGLRAPVRLLEAADSDEATTTYNSSGEEDPFGAKAWPAAYLAAERLLAEGVRGRSVLELGCGTGLVSIAALLGGARFVLATDRARPNLDRAKASAALNGQSLDAELFDVTLSLPLPSRDSPVCGNMRTALYAPACAHELPDVFDYVVFSDVLYWPREAAGFGRRAAEAYAAGSTVIIVDPGRRREDFIGALESELLQRDVQHLPSLETSPAPCPEHVYSWVSAEVRTASSLFCEQPFELILRHPGPGTAPPVQMPSYFEPVE